MNEKIKAISKEEAMEKAGEFAKNIQGTLEDDVYQLIDQMRHDLVDSLGEFFPVPVVRAMGESFEKLMATYILIALEPHYGLEGAVDHLSRKAGLYLAKVKNESYKN